MFEFLALGDYIQQILAALIVLLFAGATILRIYLICPLHASIREHFASSPIDDEPNASFNHTKPIEAGIIDG